MKVRIRGRHWKFNLCALMLLPPFLVAGATRSDAQTKAYVTHSGANIVTVIDTKTNAVTGTISVGSNPAAVVVNRDGTLAFVTNGGSSSVSVIDTACDLAAEEPACVVRTIPVGAGPSDLVVSPDGQWLYVMTASGVVEVVGTDGTSVGPSYNIGGAGALGISPDGKRVYVAAGQVYVINTDDQTVHSFAPEKEAFATISNSASSIAVASDGTVYVGVVTYYFSGPFGFAAGGNLLVVDPSSEAIVDAINLFALPGEIALTPDGSRAYVGISYFWAQTGYGAGFLPGRYAEVIDTIDHGIAGIIDFGADGADFTLQNSAAGIGVTPDRSAVYSAIPRIGVVHVADVNTNLVTSLLPVTASPGSVAIASDHLVTLKPYVVAAADDTGDASIAGGVAVQNVLANDQLGGIRVSTKHVTLTSLSAADGVTLDTLSGAVSVAAGTAIGSHSLSYRICENTDASNCDDATVSVNVHAPLVIDAANDSAVSFPGGAVIASVLSNDTLDGGAAAGRVTLSAVSSTNSGVTLDTNYGTVYVADGTAAGTYTLTYRICESASPSNCDAADATITVKAFPIAAADDSGSALRTGGTAVASVLFNDTFANGAAGLSSRIQLTQLDSTNPGVALNPVNGAVTVAAGTPVGTQTLHYRLCESATSSNCATATVTVTVQHLPLFAASYSVKASSKNASTALPSVLANDRLNGALATLANVRLSLVSVSPANNMITLDLKDGSVDILGKSSNSVTHTLTYQICESAMPSNCAQGTVTIALSGGGGGGGR